MSTVFGSYPSRLDKRDGSIRLQIMRSKNVRGDSTYPIFTIDMLFSRKTLSFAHWDVEGSEPMVLDGAVATIYGLDRSPASCVILMESERNSPKFRFGVFSIEKASLVISVN